ncbi:IPT/TIG domain-containing protein [Niabella ginsengisoli]|uniref:IPT/TIG domain-containing protein n=1 Tax=Niabella ginsengisoli TaxID=522298 RepID=A0ABS9SL05_9BACT|nr:IPT/TIG domain-containing protein [Niabella ginsengisoli]MCH5599067.1 IPT/TIG domain-containing protein [Niabella ginsengisoli]
MKAVLSQLKYLWGILFMLFIVFSCKKDEKSINQGVPFDPSKPVTIDRFTPDSGGVTTQMLIYGSNFGTDTSLIKVYINDKRAPLIGSTGSILYVLVPSKAGTGDVKVVIGNSSDPKEIKSSTAFNYIFRPSVSTLAGFKNERNESSIVDGDIKIAQFEEPYWLCFDQHKNIYLLEEYRGLRFIDSALTNVKTLFRTGNGLGRPRTLAFNPTWDTLYVTNDQGDDRGISTAVLTPASGFTRWNALTYSRQCNGGDVQPQTGDYFINSYANGQVYQWDRTAKTLRELYRVGDNQWEFNIQFAPSGDFAYLVAVNRHYILRADYNRQTRTLESPVHFVGQRGSSGYFDGVGTNAKFNEPHQGAFDEFENFYVCDRVNHVIRKITPDGVVSTFAGRPNQPGYTDGALRDAQFDRPVGIIYDKEIGTFYIADQVNRRIRVITTE